MTFAIAPTPLFRVPDRSYDAVVSLPADELQRIVRSLQAVAEVVTIDLDKDGVRFSAEGDMGSVVVTLRQTANEQAMNGASRESSESDQDEDDEADPTKVTVSVQQPVSLNFSAVYLALLTRGSPLSAYVELHTSTHLPLMIEHLFDGSHVRFYLAPKVKDV